MNPHPAIAEIVALHEVFEAWLSGRARPDAFSRIETALADSFSMIPPDGALLSRSDVLARLEQAHGARGASFSIVIEEPTLVALLDGHALVRYVERQSGAHASVRRASALLAPDPDAQNGPHGFVWRHVQETWCG